MSVIIVPHVKAFTIMVVSHLLRDVLILICHLCTSLAFVRQFLGCGFMLKCALICCCL